MTRCLWTYFAAGLLASMSWPSHAANVGGIDYPSTLGAFHLRSVIDNEKTNPGLGVTLLYNAPGVKVSLFVYDHSQRGMAEGVDSAEAHREFSEAKRNVQLAYPDTKVLLGEERLMINGIPTLHSSFQYTETKAEATALVISHLYLTVRRANFVKVRATYSALDHPELGNRGHLNFIEDLCRALSDQHQEKPTKGS